MFGGQLAFERGLGCFCCGYSWCRSFRLVELRELLLEDGTPLPIGQLLPDQFFGAFFPIGLIGLIMV